MLNKTLSKGIFRRSVEFEWSSINLGVTRVNIVQGKVTKNKVVHRGIHREILLVIKSNKNYG